MEDLLIDVEKFTGLVIYSLDDWEFCIDFRNVLLILKGDELKHIENLNTFLHNAEDESPSDFLVVDFPGFFGLKGRKIGPQSRVIFVQHKDAEFGFFVDGIKEIITVDKEFVRNKLEFISIAGTDNIKGLIKFENRTFLYPDYDKIVRTSLRQKSEKIA
jgi:purine-binding chemotaxis protein CheW